MNSTLWISKTGMTAQDAQMRTIANNLANVNTAGFKKDALVLEDMFYQIETPPGATLDGVNGLTSGIQMGTGVSVLGTQKDFSTGNLENTQNPLDIAITGKGFFQIEGADGDIFYARNGQFQLNEEGQMVLANGLPLAQTVMIPPEASNLSVSSNGIVSVQLPSERERVEIGEILTVSFMNPTGLQALGGHLYRATDASGEPIEGVPGEEGLGELQQFSVEASNVEVVNEMVRMISVQRAYEMNTRVVSAADDMLRNLSQAV